MKYFQTLLFSICFVGSLICSCSSTSTSFSYEAYIVDVDTKTGIHNADVTLDSGDKSSHTTTDIKGHFSISVSTYPQNSTAAVLNVYKSGYSSYTETKNAILSFDKDTIYLEKIR